MFPLSGVNKASDQGRYQTEPTDQQDEREHQAIFDVRSTLPTQLQSENNPPLSLSLRKEWSEQLATQRAALQNKAETKAGLEKLAVALDNSYTDKKQVLLSLLVGFIGGLFYYRYANDLSPIRPGVGGDHHLVSRSNIQQLETTCSLPSTQLGPAAHLCERLYNAMPDLAELVDFVRASEQSEFVRVHGIERYGIERFTAVPETSPFWTASLVTLTCVLLVTLFVLHYKLTAIVHR